MSRNSWEETWEATDDVNGMIEILDGEERMPIARFTHSAIAPERADWSQHNDARAQLAACAPEMARMLLEEENDGDSRCPRCHGIGVRLEVADVGDARASDDYESVDP